MSLNSWSAEAACVLMEGGSVKEVVGDINKRTSAFSASVFSKGLVRGRACYGAG